MQLLVAVLMGHDSVTSKWILIHDVVVGLLIYGYVCDTIIGQQGSTRWI